MTLPTHSFLGLALLAGSSLVTPAFAIISMAYVTVDGYKIGKNEVTNSQYAAFLNAKGESNSNGIYNANMASYGITQSGSSGSFTYSVTGALANRPVVYVSWYDAARFTNWLCNGQGSGSMETGAYTLTGNTGSMTRNAGATVWIPSGSEWYKAASYDPNKGGAGIGGNWLYPTRSDTLAGNTIGVAHSANYGHYAGWPNGLSLTDVGAYGANSASYFGTNDQGGNACEWNDDIITTGLHFGPVRGLRGGACDSPESELQSGFDANILLDWGAIAELGNIGFRVASIPEPTSILLTVLAGGVMIARRKR